MKLSMIIATDHNCGIGLNNQLPWHLPDELRYFKEQTVGKVVIMGKNTFESIGKALPNRYNIVLTTDRSFKADDVDVVHSFEEAVQVAETLAQELQVEIVVIGGKAVYELFAPLVTKVYLTVIHQTFDTDTKIYLWELLGLSWGFPTNAWSLDLMQPVSPVHPEQVAYTKYIYTKIVGD